MRKLPYAATAELNPSTDAASARSKSAGMIRNVEPLPIPEHTNRTRNVPRNGPKPPPRSVAITATAAAPIAANVQNVTIAPPKRSASQPPSGRASEPASGPASGPRNANSAELTAGNAVFISRGRAAEEPTNVPNVPTYSQLTIQVCLRRRTA